MDEDEGVELEEGMPVVDPEGKELGRLGALLVEEDADEAEFLLLKAGNADRLVPFDAVLGVGDGSLVLDVPPDTVARYPQIRADTDPTDAEMEMSYHVFEEHAGSYGEEDDEDE